MPEYNECEHFGIDPKIVAKFENRITKLLKDMDKYNLSLFCGSSCTIRADDRGEDGRELIVGSFSGRNTDGGCGACSPDEYGLLRGE